MSQGVVFTIGAGDLSLEHLSRRIEYRDISYVIDVRTRPVALYSPQHEALDAHLGERGIRYVDLSESLGDRPRDVSVFVQGELDPARFWSRPWAQEGLTRLFNAYQQGLRIAILDRDDDLLSSHRARCLGAWLWRQDIEPRHITRFDNELSQLGVEASLARRGIRLPR